MTKTFTTEQIVIEVLARVMLYKDAPASKLSTSLEQLVVDIDGQREREAA